MFTLGVFPIVPGYIAKELKIAVISSQRIGPSWGDEGQPKVDSLLQGAPGRSASSAFTLFWEPLLKLLLALSLASPLMTWVSLPTDQFLRLVPAAYIKPTGFRWPPALNVLFIAANSCFHDASCLSWSLYHPKKGIMKYMAFIWVAMLFVIFHLGDAYWRRHVKLQRVFFSLLKISPQRIKYSSVLQEHCSSFFAPSPVFHGNIFRCLQYILFS